MRKSGVTGASSALRSFRAMRTTPLCTAGLLLVAFRGVVLERVAIEAKISELVGRYLASRDQAGT